MGELIFIRLIPQFLMSTKKQKIIKQRIQKSINNKKKGQGGNFGKSGKMVNTTIYSLHSTMGMWFHLLLIPYSIISSATWYYIPSSHNHCHITLFELSSSCQTRMTPNNFLKSFLPLPPQLQSNLYSIFRWKPPLSILWSPVDSKLSAT